MDRWLTMKMVSVQQRFHGRTGLHYYFPYLQGGARAMSSGNQCKTHGNIRNEQRLILHHPFSFQSAHFSITSSHLLPRYVDETLLVKTAKVF